MTIKEHKYKFAYEKNLLVDVSIYPVVVVSIIPVDVVSGNPVVVLLVLPDDVVVLVSIIPVVVISGDSVVVLLAERDLLLRKSQHYTNTYMAQLYFECTATWQSNCV